MGELIYRTSRDVKRAWWAKALIRSKQERFQNGMTVAEWCKQYNVSEKSYWYYHKLLGDELVRLANEQEEPLVPVAAQNTCDNMPVFTELTIPKEDGAFLIQKEKRTSNAANLEISGRDQQDQRIYLLRSEEKLCWDLEKIETKLWEAPPEPLLEEIAKRITEECPEWSGSPTELFGFLSVDMKANALTQKLNVNAGRLFQEYGIQYWNKRTHAGRQVGLRLPPRDDVFDSGDGPKKTVTIDTDRHGWFG